MLNAWRGRHAPPFPRHTRGGTPAPREFSRGCRGDPCGRPVHPVHIVHPVHKVAHGVLAMRREARHLAVRYPGNAEHPFGMKRYPLPSWCSALPWHCLCTTPASYLNGKGVKSYSSSSGGVCLNFRHLPLKIASIMSFPVSVPASPVRSPNLGLDIISLFSM